MDITGNYHNLAEWMDGSGPLSDIVISSRVRLARNFSGFPFVSKADKTKRQEIIDFASEQLKMPFYSEKMTFKTLDSMQPLERSILAERYIITEKLANDCEGTAVVVTPNESLSVMINEEDHLRIQAFSSGLDISSAWQEVISIEDKFQEKVSYAFSEQYGYLTACPTNVGTGIRISAMLHLPALHITKQIEKVLNAARDMHLAVRGQHGEGSEPAGDLFQVSNQTTLGKTEEQIIEEITTLAIEPIVEYERRAREKLLKESPVLVDDKVYRAMGILNNARLITSQEAMFFLSQLRMGVSMGKIDIPLRVINEITLLVQPAHLQFLCGNNLEASHRDQFRADLIRQKLSDYS